MQLRRVAGSAGRMLGILGVVLGLGAHAGAHGDEPGGGGPPPGALSNVPCVDGFADVYPCSHVDLLSLFPLDVFAAGDANDLWGWTDPQTGVEYALLGLEGGIAFVDLSDPTQPVYVGLLPTHTSRSLWRDVKVHADHAFVVSEATGHGMQVFDLNQLRDVTSPPVSFSATAHYAGFGDAHNIVVNEDTGFAYAVGANSCSRGLHMIDVSIPSLPVFAGCFSADGYTHDAQCVVYHGPDAAYFGHEICFAFNEDTLTLVDVTEKTSTVQLARVGYAGLGYTHQGWLSEDHAFLLLDDELDEWNFGHGTRTYVWDVSDLESPALLGHVTSTSPATDHNQYVVGNHVYQANYRSGVRVLRLGDLASVDLAEVAFFDTHPASDDAGFEGTWSVYPFFGSGTVIASDIGSGLFVLAPDLAAVPECSDGVDNDHDGLTDLADPQCASPSDDRERPRPRRCGLGFELALGLPAVLAVRARRRRAGGGRRETL